MTRSTKPMMFAKRPLTGEGKTRVFPKLAKKAAEVVDEPPDDDRVSRVSRHKRRS